MAALPERGERRPVGDYPRPAVPSTDQHNSVPVLLRHPEQLARLNDDPSLILAGARVLPEQQREWRGQGLVGDRGPVTDNIAGSSAPETSLSADGYVGDPEVRAEWDNRYADRQRLWSGRPNGALVAEVAGLPRGRVLDVGCGEGADAVWLARGGWEVTALEVSGVALERAAGHARDAGVTVRWVHAGLAEAALPRPPSTWSPRSTRRCCGHPTPRPSERCSRPSRPVACCCSCTTRGWTPGMTTMPISTRPTTSGPPWSPLCSTTTGGWRWTSSGRAWHLTAAPVRTTPTTWCCGRVDCAESRARCLREGRPAAP